MRAPKTRVALAQRREQTSACFPHKCAMAMACVYTRPLAKFPAPRFRTPRTHGVAVPRRLALTGAVVAHCASPRTVYCV